MRFLLFLGMLYLALAAPERDFVDFLPGMNNDQAFSFKMYSGYLMVPKSTRNLHYVYIESQKDPVNDPILVWFNGGPGCSSMLGMLTEHGPYVLKDGATNFQENKWPWNLEANVLYIESPAGVGYSYWIDRDGYKFTDLNSAQDNLNALMSFFVFKFPERQTNDLWLSGESYAGIYVPTLAYQIDQYNKDAAEKEMQTNTKVFQFNLKGFLVGNGVTNWKYDTVPAYVEMAFWHGLYDQRLWDNLNANDCLKQFEYMGLGEDVNMTDTCATLFQEFEDFTTNINVYNIYGECYNTTKPYNEFELYVANKQEFLKVGNEIKTYNKYFTSADYTFWTGRKTTSHQHKLKDLPPCTYGYPVIDYLNRDDVKEKLHIPSDIDSWDFCNSSIGEEYQRNKSGSQWVYEALQGKYKILVYSGDMDGAVPTLGTLRWINELNWDVKKQWGPFFHSKQVAGYYEVRDGLTFMTIHGCGHMAPGDCPGKSYGGIFDFMFGRLHDN